MISNIQFIFRVKTKSQTMRPVVESPIEMLSIDKITNISKSDQLKHPNNKNIGLKKQKKDTKDTKDMAKKKKKNIKEQADNEEKKSECKEEDNEYDKETMIKIEEALAKNKTILHKLLSNSYDNIKVAFDYLEFDRLSEENKIENHYESVI